MKDIVNILTERFRQEHRNARRYLALVLVLALLTTLFVNWQLHSDGIAATAQYQCGEVEHQHTADCCHPYRRMGSGSAHRGAEPAGL